MHMTCEDLPVERPYLPFPHYVAWHQTWLGAWLWCEVAPAHMMRARTSRRPNKICNYSNNTSCWTAEDRWLHDWMLGHRTVQIQGLTCR